MIASWGKRLIDWLNTYTFPEEARFADPDYATDIAGRYLDLVTSNGTTTVASYCTIHPASVTAFFAAAQTRGMRALAGKTCMDRNAPDDLRDTAQSAYDDSRALLEAWHGVDRLGYVITPRFSPTSTPEQLSALGALWAEHPECLMQTHLSEQVDEIAWVRDLYPNARDYLDTYEAHGLLGPRGVLRPCDPPGTARNCALARGGRGRRSLPDVEHLHRIGAVRHGSGRHDARGSGDGYGWRLQLFDAAHNGRCL